MNNSPALPGGLLKSKPTWPNAYGCFATSAFFVVRSARRSESTETFLTHGGDAMVLAITAVASWNGIAAVPQSRPRLSQKNRIIEALGSVNHIPKVDEEPLSRYYKYLKEHLPFPLLAHFPIPMTSQEEEEFRCTVAELLDPAEHLGDGFDGIFCKTRKGKYELNLPLIDLYLPEDSLSFQLIEDYWHWFWNWR